MYFIVHSVPIQPALFKPFFNSLGEGYGWTTSLHQGGTDETDRLFSRIFYRSKFPGLMVCYFGGFCRVSTRISSLSCSLPNYWKHLNVQRQMGTYGVHMNRGGVLPCGWFVGLLMPLQKIFVLPWLLQSSRYTIFFPHCTLFQFICPYRPASWPGSRAASPVS